MAIAFEIKGKTLIKSGSDVWGMTDAEDTVTVEEVIHQKEIHSNESGPELPAKVINLGRHLVIRAPLTQWDDALIDAQQKAVGATSLGQLGTLGADVRTFALSVIPAISGAKGFTSATCFFIETIPISAWGLMEAKKLLVVKAVPAMNALSTATTPYTVVAAV